MSCAFARLTVWTLRRWFRSDRSLRARAPLELVWIEQDLALAWSWFESFLSILDDECTRELAIASPHGIDTSTMTDDESAVLGCLIFAPWSPGAARACLAPFLSRQSAEAAVCAAARSRCSSGMSGGAVPNRVGRHRVRVDPGLAVAYAHARQVSHRSAAADRDRVIGATAGGGDVGGDSGTGATGVRAGARSETERGAKG